MLKKGKNEKSIGKTAFCLFQNRSLINNSNYLLNQLELNMPGLFKRILFEVAGTQNERTLTLSSTSTDGHFISLRPLVKPATKEEIEFPWEWVFAGLNTNVNVSVAGNVTKQVFDMGFDANVYLGIENTHRGSIHTNWITWDSGCLQETGTVYPFGADKEGVDFVEVWQPIDANEEKFIMIDGEAKAKSITFQVDTDDFEGLLIVVGNYAQGYLAQKGTNTTKGLNFLRTYNDKVLVEFGSNVSKFPTDYNNVKKGDKIEVEGLTWNVIEAYL